MHALWLALALGAAEAPPAPAVAPVPVSAPAAPEPAPPVAPALVSSDPATAPATSAPSPSPAGAPAPSPSPAQASPAAAEAPPARPPPPLPQAAVEKLGLGDRAFLDRDYRNALFAYQDAVYLAPKSPAARVKLGRAYLALRYAARAIEQAELALAADPGSAEARRLLDEARNPVPRPAPAAAAPTASAVAAPAATSTSANPAPRASAAATPAATGAAAVTAQPRVYRFMPEADAAAPSDAAPPSAGSAATPAPTARAEPASVESPRTVAVAAAAIEPPAAQAPAPGRSAGQRYREALAQLQSREFAKADETLTDAIAVDPRLAVAHSARGSARFGLGRYRDAATDYRTALELDAALGTPLYGLAECYRVLGDPRGAAEMYERYARSGAADVREDLREIASKRAQELR